MQIQVNDLFTNIGNAIRFIVQLNISNTIHTTLRMPSYHAYNVLTIHCNSKLQFISYQFLSKLYILLQ